MKLLKLLAIGQNRNATCELFGTYSSADDGPQKKDAGNILPEISVLEA
jgi:hypothetical protein